MRERNNKKTAVILGAGPAGLTAAYELIMKTDVKPLVFEMLAQVGGIARTIDYKSNKMDLGGHRFFSKSESIMEWWLDIMPLASTQNSSGGTACVHDDKSAMLIRDRISRILFSGKFFYYPLRFDSETFSGLGLKKISKIILSCLRAKAFPIQHERSIEDFFINRFGRELYDIFFKNYTDKIENLFLVGRNGMHRYYNMDYAMLSAMEAVKNISENKKCKDNLWQLTL